jgi:hypothetical protein
MDVTPYDILRGQLRTGDALVCQGTNGFSSLIKFATKKKQTHVGMIVVLDDIDRVIVIESVESKGVRTVGLSKYLTNYDNKGNAYNGEIYVLRHKDFDHIRKSNPEKLDEMLTFAIDAMGYPYSVKQIAKLVYRLFFKKAISKLLTSQRTEWICSVFVGDLYKVFGLIIPQEDLSSGASYLIPGDYAEGENFEMIGRLK